MKVKITKSIAQEEAVDELYSFFKNEQLHGQSEAYLEAIECIARLENQYAALQKEIMEIKLMLSTRGNETAAASMAPIVRETEGTVLRIGDKLTEIKEQVVAACKQMVASVREGGLLALYNVSNYFGVKDALQDLSNSLHTAGEKSQQSIEKIASVSQEYHKVELGARNIGAILANKAPSQEVKENGKISEAFQKPYAAMKNMYGNMQRNVDGAVQSFEKLENRVKQAVEIAEEQKLLPQMAGHGFENDDEFCR